MWQHFCPAQGTVLAVAKGQPCNWCDAKPSVFLRLVAAATLTRHEDAP